jgi:hypothetical protein
MKRLIVLISLACRAAIGVSEPVAEIASTSNSATYAFGAFTPSSNAVLVIIAAASGEAITTATVTGGLTWKQKCAVTYNSTSRAYALWAYTGSSPGSLTFTIDFGADSATGIVMSMYQFTGVQLGSTDPILQCATNATTAANPVATFASAMNTNNGYAAAFGMGRNPPTSTPPASWTETHDTGYGTPTSGAAGAYRAGGETGTTVTFTSASADYGIIAVEVCESAAALCPLPPAVQRRAILIL